MNCTPVVLFPCGSAFCGGPIIRHNGYKTLNYGKSSISFVTWILEIATDKETTATEGEQRRYSNNYSYNTGKPLYHRQRTIHSGSNKYKIRNTRKHVTIDIVAYRKSNEKQVQVNKATT
jgi:hypothetical protein